MNIGKKAQGQEALEKMLAARHGGASKHVANRIERAAERRVRRQGKTEAKADRES